MPRRFHLCDETESIGGAAVLVSGIRLFDLLQMNCNKRFTFGERKCVIMTDHVETKTIGGSWRLQFVG